jgi:transposase
VAQPKRKATATEAFALVFALAENDNLADYQVANYARKLTDLPNRERVVVRSLKDLVEHEKPSRRRIGVTVCRVIGRFAVPGLREALLRRLADENPWVRRDAVNAVSDAGYDGPEVRALLANLVGDRESLEKASSELWMKSDVYGLISVGCNESNVGLWVRVLASHALDSLIEKETTLNTGTDETA